MSDRPIPQVLRCLSCKIDVLELADGTCAWCAHPPRKRPTAESVARAALSHELWRRHEANLADELRETVRRVMGEAA